MRQFPTTLLIAMLVTGLNAGQSALATEPQAYLDACTDAQAHALSPEGWIADNLVTIEAGTPGLQWEGEPGNSRVLMTMYTSSQYYNREGQSNVVHPDLWVTAGTQLYDFYIAHGVTADQIALRTQQLLGLPTSTTYDAIVEVYVQPADMFRPSADPSLTNPVSSTAFPAGVSDSYVAWFNKNITSSYGNADPNRRYPWSQLGYTYDWAGNGSDLAAIQGLSEFVIPSQNWTHRVTTYAVYSLQSYLYTDRQGNFTITGPCDTVWGGSRYTPMASESGEYVITVTADGVISGGQGIDASSAGAVILNFGAITGPTAPKYRISGTENISVLLEHGGLVLNDGGTISGNAVAIASWSGADVENERALILLRGGGVSGSVCAIRTGAANDMVMGQATEISGGIETGAGNDVVLLADSVMTGYIATGDGDDAVLLRGCDFRGDIDGGNGEDRLLLAAQTFTEDVVLGHDPLANPATAAVLDFERVYLEEQLQAPHILVASGTLLEGAGQLRGDVVNRGIIAPGTDSGEIDTIAIDGNFDHYGLLQIEATSTTNDALTVTGTATLRPGSAIQVRQLPGQLLADGQQLTVIDALGTGQVINEGVVVTSNSLLLHFAPAPTRGDDLVLTCSRDPYATHATTHDAAAVGNALNAGLPEATGDMADILGKLDFMSSGTEIGHALSQLTPDAYEAINTVTLRGVSLFGNAFFEAARQRPAPTKPDLTALSDPWSGPLLAEAGEDAPVTAQAVAAARAAAPEPGHRWQGYATAYGQKGYQDATGSLAGQDYDMAGTVFGVERRSGDGFREGLVGSYAEARTSLADHGGSGTVTSLRLGPAAAVTNGPWFAGTFLTYGHHEVEVTRHLDFADVQRTAEADYEAHDISAFVGGGYDIKLGTFTLTPEASLQYTWLSAEDASESGAQSLNLDVDSHQVQSLIGMAGLRLERPVALKWGRIIPAVWVRQEHEELWDSKHLQASLAGAPDHPFDSSLAIPAEDRTRLGVAFRAVTAERGIFLELRYEYLTGSQLQEHTGALAVGMPF